MSGKKASQSTVFGRLLTCGALIGSLLTTVVVGADPRQVAGGGVDAKVGAAHRAVCMRSGAIARDGVSGRELVCWVTKRGVLRWQFRQTTAVTTTSTSTTTVPGVVAPVLVSVSASDALRVTVAGMRPDTGVYALQWVPYGQSFNTFQMARATSPSMSLPAGWFACNHTYTFRVFVMQADWQLADGHQTQNVTPHSTSFDVVMPACTTPTPTTTTTVPTTTTTTAPTTTTTTTVAPVACADGGVCVVGDTGPGGGKVFYVHASGMFACGATLASTCKYLEAALSDRSSGVAWCSNTTSALGTTGTAIGTGMANTTTADTTCTTGAIQIAADYTNNSKTDWHLPSKDELNQLYIQRATVGGFPPSTYWSSSERNALIAWTQNFASGIQYDEFKDVTFYVRPVRAFGGTLACADGGVCAVGDTGPGGGKVFYVSATNFTSTGSDCGTTCKYLEAAPSDQSSGIAWCSNSTSALGTTGTAIGTGMANTTTADTTCTTGAIQIAADYTNNSKSDWYLPSIAELNQLYIEKARIGGFSINWYWSSSEFAAVEAEMQKFDTGVQYYFEKSFSAYVRPVRAFG
jgi:hypothetical protein